MDDIDLGIATEAAQLGAIGQEFHDAAGQLGLVVTREHRDDFSVKAGLEWVMPTAIALFVANKYFGTMLQEAAKEHYPLLKAAVLRLVRRTTGPSREVRLQVPTSTPGKVAEPEPATLSVWVALNASRRAVFRFDHDLGMDDLATATEKLFELLETHGIGKGADLLARAPAFLPSSWAPVLLKFDPQLGEWRPWTLDGQSKPTPVD